MVYIIKDPCNFKLSACFRVTNTRCRIGTVFSPDDGHTFARNMYREAINKLRKFLHQVCSNYKGLYRDAGQKIIKKKNVGGSCRNLRTLNS